MSGSGDQIKLPPDLSAEHADAMSAPPGEFADLITDCLPSLHRYARNLCQGDAALADDCVQDACLNALQAFANFDSARPFRPWMISIVRNAYLQRARRNWRIVADPEGILATTLAAPGNPEQRAEALELLTLIAGLPEEYGDALSLVAGLGLTYGEAAASAGCAVGTMKSRVSRGRTLLFSALLAKESGTTASFRRPARNSDQAA